MFKSIKNLVLAMLTGLALSSGAFANGYSGLVTITSVGTFGGDDYVFFKLSGRGANAHSQCTDERMAINILTNMGKAQYSFLLSAEATSKNITVEGYGVCLYGTMENVHWIGS
jgi:hypothetical protein